MTGRADIDSSVADLAHHTGGPNEIYPGKLALSYDKIKNNNHLTPRIFYLRFMGAGLHFKKVQMHKNDEAREIEILV